MKVASLQQFYLTSSPVNLCARDTRSTLCWIISTERYSDPSASYKNDVGQTNCMSAQQNGYGIAHGEQKSQQRTPMIKKIKIPIAVKQ